MEIIYSGGGGPHLAEAASAETFGIARRGAASA